MSEWQPIETAPKDEARIYAVQYNPDWPASLFYVSTVYWQALDDVNGIWVAEDRNEVEDPTHWMPLLAPPAS